MPKLLNTLRNIVLYVVLAKHDNEQSDLLHRVAEERLLEDLPNYQKVGDLGANALIVDFVQIGKSCALKYILILQVLEKFTTKELISQADFSAEYEALLRDGAEATGVFSRYTELCTPTISRRILINFIQTRPDGRSLFEYDVHNQGRSWREEMGRLEGESGGTQHQVSENTKPWHYSRFLRLKYVEAHDYLNAQDDGPVLHKDPSWSHGDFAGAHRGRN